MHAAARPLRRTALLASALALAGCVVGPDYRRPDVQVPPSYLYPVGQDAALADAEWWKSFGDPVLDSLIAEALAHNRDIRIAAANIEQAAGVLQSTRSAFYPQINYQLNSGRFRFTENGLTEQATGISNPTHYYQALAGASWEIDLWGRVRRETEAAQAQLLATEQARRGVLLSLVSSVAGSYLQLRALDQQLVISQRTLEAYAESVKLFELQNKYGQTSMMTVEQARSQYESAAAQIPQISQQIVETENAINILLGRNPGPVPRGAPLKDIALPAVPAGLPSTLLEQRPDIAQAEQNLIAANALIGAAKAQYYPSISLTAGYGTASSDLSNLFKGGSRTWSYGGSITGPIFTGGSIFGQVAQATASQKAALYAYQQSIQNAFGDVETSLSAREQLTVQLQAEEKLVKALREYARLARLQYDGGYTPYLTVLYAEQQLFPAELNYVRTLAQLYVASVNIYKATGGGWIDEANAMAPQPVPEKW